ncbi:nitroreductase family protein, partial [Desulfuromonas acetexigens]
MSKPSISQSAGRHFLTDRIRLEVDWRRTAQSRGIAPPPAQKPAPEGATLIPLPDRESWAIPPCDLEEAIARRESRRRFLPSPLSREELAFLLWSTQGVRARLHEAAVLRTVPSAGCRHPFETYLAIFRVEGLAPGLYRYLPLDHALLLEQTPDQLSARVVAAARGQGFA